MEELLHPEKALLREGIAYPTLRKEWFQIVQRDGVETLEKYLKAVSELEKIREVLEKGTVNTKEQAWSMTAYNRVVMEGVFESLENPSYSNAVTDPRFKVADLQERSLTESMARAAGVDIRPFAEMLLTEIILRHAVCLWRRSGKKIYEVSPALRWQLENTELRKYPSEDLKPPHHAIYIDLRGTEHKVYNQLTGWHPIEGAYVVEDTTCQPRRWRLIVVGSNNENSPSVEDDALYHWTIVFPEDSTVEEALKYTVETSLAPGKRELNVNGKVMTFDNNPVGTSAARKKQLEIFAEMEPVLMALFKYVMNVILYATLSDADAVFSDASKEYRRLKDRAHKLPKSSPKRKKLFSQMNDIGAKPRIVLGGSIVIDRKKESSYDSESGESGRKQKVRSVVSGHWHTYLIGEGRKNKVRKWLAPYWRGPELAPLTSKKHVLK